jgi:hypothetical protein
MNASLVLAVGVLLTSASMAQTAAANNPLPGAASFNITGRGTTNFLPKFHSPTQIDSSTIYESSDGNIGIGTTAPLFPLHVYSNTAGSQGQTPGSLFVERDFFNTRAILTGTSRRGGN